MKRVIFILGGARSGKSRYAVESAKKFSKKVAFIATATPCDKEMSKRIRVHKLSRPTYWKTVEEGKDVVSAFSDLREKYDVILIDCLGLLISNLLCDGLKDIDIEKRMKSLARAITKLNSVTIVVSNEVGMGIVPDNRLSRRFRDLIGLANQTMASIADEVIFMQTGIPVKIKGG